MCCTFYMLVFLGMSYMGYIILSDFNKSASDLQILFGGPDVRKRHLSINTKKRCLAWGGLFDTHCALVFTLLAI